MTRLRIVAVTVVAVLIASAAWWVPFKVSNGDGCPGGGMCGEEFPAPGVSGGPSWFYGGEGVDPIREGSDRPATQDGTGGGNVIRCRPDRYSAPTDAGKEPPQSCEDVRARFY